MDFFFLLFFTSVMYRNLYVEIKLYRHNIFYLERKKKNKKEKLAIYRIYAYPQKYIKYTKPKTENFRII